MRAADLSSNTSMSSTFALRVTTRTRPAICEHSAALLVRAGSALTTDMICVSQALSARTISDFIVAATTFLAGALMPPEVLWRAHRQMISMCAWWWVVAVRLRRRTSWKEQGRRQRT